jgi:hypothetical protein
MLLCGNFPAEKMLHFYLEGVATSSLSGDDRHCDIVNRLLFPSCLTATNGRGKEISVPFANVWLTTNFKNAPEDVTQACGFSRQSLGSCTKYIESRPRCRLEKTGYSAIDFANAVSLSNGEDPGRSISSSSVVNLGFCSI